MGVGKSSKNQLVVNDINVQTLIGMFDLVPNTLFWIKDEQCRFIHANQVFIEHSGMRCLSRIVGRTDYAISPPHLARQYILDDRKVMTGDIVTNRIELNMLSSGEFGWYSTSKRPLQNDDGTIVGTYGFTHHLEQTSQALSSIDAIRAPVEFVRENYQKDFTVEDLAKVSFLSVSALERRFKKHLGKTPKQFVNEVRLENARRMLTDTALPIVEIAYRCGFSEHSYFSRQFKKMFGTLPSALREQMIKQSSQQELPATRESVLAQSALQESLN
ncbi:response regulator transcription factor [Alteromonas sp. KUL49]|uniref:AraC family transcriptional regulator n=1 Tax=Alteromonas sp. KUL49 TaxID=2480798 RepID=UPI00102EF2D5|nr:response regulator transcription factor [Alteromonas sp. KUL49]TAP40787.1 AraC family transcriptional regulator [Alteromonas sp. KUL49]GEA10960.1 transcriptional regulator [Alteromonas sp. KUL49]